MSDFSELGSVGNRIQLYIISYVKGHIINYVLRVITIWILPNQQFPLMGCSTHLIKTYGT